MTTEITPELTHVIRDWIDNGFVCAICKQRKPYMELGYNYHVTVQPETEYRPVCSACNATNFICEKGCSHKGKGRGITMSLEAMLEAVNEVSERTDVKKRITHGN